MEKTTLSSLKDLYGLFLRYKHLQLFYTNETGCSISFIAHIKEVHLRSSHIEEIIIQSPSGCIILKDYYRSSDGVLIKQDVSLTFDNEHRQNVEVHIGSFSISFYLF